MNTNTTPSEIAAVDLDQIMRELDAGTNRLPRDAIRAAQQHRDLIIPRLIQALEDATARTAAGNPLQGSNG